MKNLLVAILAVVIADLLFSRCANPGSPTGGPKDTIPPKLINSNPTNGSINFQEQSITLDFSEYINADKLAQKLIITPKTEITFKHLIKKNQLSIKFDKPFADSTTYSLNFFDGVTDITEKNPAVNLVLAFSTGSYIDSIKVSGTVIDLLTENPSDKFTVGLYPLTDSLDYLTQSPLYFTATYDSGTFDISYIKAGLYKILSFNDLNKNLILDPQEEDHGFLLDTLNLASSITQLKIRTLLQNIRPLQLTNNRPVGKYHEIKFNKTVDSYNITPDTIYSSLEGENKDIIRLYNNGSFNYGDSIPIVLEASDSLLNSVTDTLKIVFMESSRKSKELQTFIKYLPKSLQDNPTYQLSFSKPIKEYNPEKLLYSADSLFSYPPDSLLFNWNKNKTNLELTTYLFKDSLYHQYEEKFKQDTLSADTTNTLQTDSVANKRGASRSSTAKPKLTFDLSPGAFISIEGDSSRLASVHHQRSTKLKYGTLKLKIETTFQSFNVQLLSSSGQVKYEQQNTKNPEFIVLPSTYKVRILIDNDNDGVWSYGNLLKDKEPENVYLFPDEIPVRENWIVEDYIISF